MYNFMYSLRGTGRTSRMLWEAANAKGEGERVMIVVHDRRMIDYCLGSNMMGRWWGLEESDFISLSNDHTYRGRRADRFYIDHFTEERAYDDPALYQRLSNLIMMQRSSPRFLHGAPRR